MKIIDTNKTKIRFLSGTYDEFKTANYSSVDNNGLADGKIFITVYQGFDEIAFVYIRAKEWQSNFIMERTNYDSSSTEHFDKLITKHNSIVRNKTIDDVLE